MNVVGFVGGFGEGIFFISQKTPISIIHMAFFLPSQIYAVDVSIQFLTKVPHALLPIVPCLTLLPFYPPGAV